jgi:2-polyprenyl-3-methyl-5-hydroxy-6-metoxy-1,4-benzoquinol methylase
MITLPLLVALAMSAPDDADQQRFWNDWNAKYRSPVAVARLDPATVRRRDTLLAWISELGLTNPRILDVGCSTGWLSAQLAKFGKVFGTDISDGSIREARQTYPDIEFECANFLKADLGGRTFDIVVAVDVLSCVADQRGFIERIQQLLRPGGYVYIATPNRLVYERRDGVSAQGEGQVRIWNYPREVRALLENGFTIRHFTTLIPDGHRGILRAVNSPRINNTLNRFVGERLVERAKERLGLGQTIAVLAQKKIGHQAHGLAGDGDRSPITGVT